jgi:hypothetical protein
MRRFLLLEGATAAASDVLGFLPHRLSLRKLRVITDDSESRRRYGVDGEWHLLQMFALSESLVYYVDGVEETAPCSQSPQHREELARHLPTPALEDIVPSRRPPGTTSALDSQRPHDARTTSTTT